LLIAQKIRDAIYFYFVISRMAVTQQHTHKITTSLGLCVVVCKM